MSTIAAELRKGDAFLGQTHTVKEWNWLVRGTFGPALVALDLDDNAEKNATSVLAAVRSQLAANPVTQDCEHAFGCTLFSHFDVASFSIGPVRFEPRDVWLSRKEMSGDVTKTTARRVRLCWLGKRSRKRKQSIDAIRERDILDVVGSCEYVCSVSTISLAPEAGRLKAQMAAHMAMAAIALQWSLPSRALSGFRLLVDPQMRRQRSLVFRPGIRTLAGSYLVGLPHGPAITDTEWLSLFTARHDDFALIGEAIQSYLGASTTSKRPNTMNALVQAVLWFYEGCREEIDLMAVVKFTATLDALANGGKSGGIKRLVHARLGISEHQKIRKDGPTLKAAVEEIYGEGRSRTIHGTNDRVGHDWSSTRLLAEAFARLCIISSLNWIVMNPVADDMSALQKP